MHIIYSYNLCLRLQNYSEEDINEGLKAIETLVVRNLCCFRAFAIRYELSICTNQEVLAINLAT